MATAVDGSVRSLAVTVAACALVLGMLSIQLLPAALPTSALTGLVLLTAAMACRPGTRPLAWLPAGLLLMHSAATDVIAERVETTLVGRDLERRVRIVDFPERRNDVTRFEAVAAASGKGAERLQLSWYDAPLLPRLGECWDLTVRLRRPRGFANPGGFDYEKWLFRRRVAATGYVRRGSIAVGCSRAAVLDRWRRRIADRLTALLPEDDATAVLLAVTIGARHRIQAEDWQRYAHTGTSHLMAISGMHIGLAAGSTFLLARVAAGLLRRRGNHRLLAAVVALLTAGVYVLLSGMAVPARRALLMLLLATIALLWRRRLMPARLLAVCMIAIALLSPLDVLSPGFQLSFAAVAVLLWLAARRRQSGGGPLWRRAWHASRQLGILQLGLLLGLLPLTAVLFGRSAWLAPAVNLIVLPVFNIVTVPAALGGLLLDGPCAALGDWLLHRAWQSTQFILAVVARASQLPMADLRLAPRRGVALLVLAASMLWLLLPVSWPARRVAWIAAAAAILHEPERPPTGCVDVHTLDVGQGLAAAIVTRRRTVVFDTGPAFRSGTDTVRLVVTPMLAYLGVGKIDLLIVSHADLDHAGGVATLRRDWSIDATLYGEPLPGHDERRWACRAGQTWSWDGVRFRILHPASPGREGNNASCVLEILAGDARLLLTGDIEAAAERRLLREDLLLSVDAVVIPHHGSATSSSRAIVQALRPQLAIASAGYGNRWNMPKAEVVARWRATGADVFNTGDDGAVSVRLCAETGVNAPRAARRRAQKFWHDP